MGPPADTAVTPASPVATTDSAPSATPAARDTEFDDDDDKSSPIAALAGVLASPTAAADDINSSPLAALNAAMATPSTETALPQDTLDDPPAFAPPVITNTTGEVASIAPTGSTADFDDDDLRPRGGLRDLIASVTGSRRNLAIVGGGLGVIVIASALAFCGGSSKPKPLAADKATQAKATAPEPAPEATPEPVANPEPTEPAPTEGSGENLGPTAEELAAANEPGEPAPSEPAPSEPSEPTTTTTKTKTKASTQTTAATKTKASTQTTPTTKTKTTPHKTVAVAQPEPRAASNLGGKQVVAETDGQARAGKSVAGVDQSSLQKARGAYLSGNKRLFAGDAASATKHYRQALTYYAGYVAAYRGLGLAYEKLGDKANALKAFRTYVGSAPGAPDVGTIKQRIAVLQR